jgi:hypothetical protein
MSYRKKIDILILILLPLVTVSALLLWQVNFLISTIFFFGLPIIYLLIRNKSLFKKAFVFSLTCSVPATILFDYLVVRDGGWYIIKTVFSFRLFDVIALEQFVWGFLWLFYSILFYECFLNKPPRKSLISFFVKADVLIAKRLEYFLMIVFAALLLFIFLIYFAPEVLALQFAYLILGTVLMIIPLTIFLFKFPNFVTRFFWAMLYFFFFSALIEYVGLSLGHWVFPGENFLGVIDFFGFRMPYEEILIYFLCFTPAALAYYEFLADDRR